MRLVALSFARFFARAPWTTLTALFGAALGVASTVAVHLISLSVADSLQANRAPHLRGVTHIATRPDADMSDYFELRRRWRAGELPGVRALVPVVDGQTIDDGRRFHIIGADWLALYGMPGERGAVDFRPGAVVVDRSLGLTVGDRLRLAGQTWPVAGVIDSGVRDGLFADIGDALALLRAPPDRLSHVGLAVHDPWKAIRTGLETLLPGLSAGLPQGYAPFMEQISQPSPELGGGVPLPASSQLVDRYEGLTTSFNTPEGEHRHPTLFQCVERVPCTSEARRTERETRMREPSAGEREGVPSACKSVVDGCALDDRTLGAADCTVADSGCALPQWSLRPVSFEQPGANLANSILFNLGALGTLALLVAWFLVYQVCVLWLRRQAPVMASLAVLGAGRGELAACFIAVVALLGLFATLLGLAGGLLLAELLTKLSTAGLGALTPPQLSAAVVAKALLSGLGVALVGGWMALRGERGSAQGESTASLRRLAWLVVLAVLAGVGIGVTATGLAGGFLAILATSLFMVALIQPILRAMRFSSGGTPGGILFRLALRETTWYERDVAAALGALVLAVATSVGIGLMVASFKLDFERMLAQRLAYEHYVEVADGDAGSLASAIAARWPDTRVQSYGDLRTRIDGRVIAVAHADYSAAEVARYGHDAALSSNEGLASESLLLALAVEVGDFVEVAGAPIRIAGAFADYGGVVPRLLLQNETTAGLFGPLHFNDIAVSGVAAADLETWLFENLPTARVRQRERARTRALEIFDRSFAITNALTLLALIVAVAGLYNAMTGLRLNRVATRQLLTALGVSAAEDRLIELVRALGLGACAIALALPLGLAMGWMLCEVVNPRAFGWRIELSLPFSALAWPMALGFVAAVFAAVAPSPRERFEVG